MNKQQEFEQIQHTLQQIFIKNLNFLKNNYPNLYQQIIQFENLNIENYSIEFINESFQLINLTTQKPYYTVDPFIDAQQRIHNFNFANGYALINLNPIEKERHYNDEINAYEYINQYIEQFDNSNISQEIKKFVFIGTLLGVHINDFHTQFKANSYLIIEPNLEIFRLSMFMTDYTALANEASLHFCIAEDTAGFNNTIDVFLTDKQEYNHIIHYELAHKEYEPYISELSLLFTQFSEMRYPFSEYIISLQRGYNYFLNEKKPILNLSQAYKFFNQKPIIFLGAGPSLKNEVQWLQNNKDQFVIVAASATLKLLELYEITPDIVILIEAKKEVINQFPSSNAIYKNSIILSSIKIDSEVYALLQDNPIFFIQNTLELFLNNGFFSGITVGDVGVDILLKLGATELYLLGIDAAISQTGETYINTHPSSKSIELKPTKNSVSTDFQKDIHYVKGNFQKEVPTFTEYLDVIEHLKQRLQNIASHIHIYNLSDGAYFYNTIPTHTKELNLTKKMIDKSAFYQEIKECFKSISKYALNDRDIKAIQKEKKVLKKLMTLKKDATIYKNFVQLKSKFEYSIVMSIVGKYFNLTNPYYNFFKNKAMIEPIREKQLDQLLKKLDTIYSEIKEK